MSFQKNPPWQKNVGLQNFQQLGLQFNQLTGGYNLQNFANLTNMPNPNNNPMQIQQYPPRINPIAFQTQAQTVNSQQQQQSQQSNQHQQQQQQQQQHSSSKYNTNFKNFSGTGTVTKIQNDIGFIDDEVLFHKNVCVNGIPKVRDLVLVEASYNIKMPFKWNATRVQVLSQQPTSMNTAQDGSGYNQMGGSSSSSQRENINDGGHRNNFSEDRDRRNRRPPSRVRDVDDENDKKRRRGDEREVNRSRPRESADRRDTRSPATRERRKRPHVAPRYMIQIPKSSLSLLSIDVMEARRRYQNLYIPSDFIASDSKWISAFPFQKPFSIERPCSFHIMKDVSSIDESVEKTVLDPSDADYTWSAKVMLISIPSIQDLHKKCVIRAEDKDEKSTDFIHPTRLISFLVGIRGKNESMAIGGPWSKKYDGENPDTDPSVLIKTATRTCKALTGIDLSSCTQWYRFLELKYRRPEQVKGDIVKPARIETVVIFFPDIYSCVPNRFEWEQLQQKYKQACDKFLSDDEVVDIISLDDKEQSRDGTVAVIDNVGNQNISVSSINEVKADAVDEHEPTDVPASSPSKLESQATEQNEDSEMPIDSNVVEKTSAIPEKLDIKNLKVPELRAELAARNLSTKGLKNELIDRLENVLREQSSTTEQTSDDATNDDVEMKVTDEVGCTDDSETGKEQEGELNFAEMDISEVTVIDEYDSTKDEKAKPVETKTNKTEVKKKFDEKEKQMWEKRYHLPDNQLSIVVHPSKTAKNGKFDCAVVSLSLLLDYRKDDTKEHSFEISLFAEAFNEMLTRDFGFNIYKAFNFFNSIKSKEGSNDKAKESVSVEKSEPNEQKAEGDGTKADKEVKEKIKLVTAYPDLLLSFCYFDQTQCGYIFEKDIEELFYCIGLNLSRSQVRKLTEKFITRDTLYYRKITDCPADTTILDPMEKVTQEQLEALAHGNRAILPAEIQTTSSSSSNSDIVMFEGSTVSLKQIVFQMRRAEKAYEESEKLLVDLRKNNTDLNNTNRKHEKKIKDLSSDYKSVSRKHQDSESNLSSMTRKYNECYSVISTIHDRVTPIIARNEKSRDRDRKSDKKSSSSASKEDGSKLSEKKVEGTPANDDKNEVKEVKQEAATTSVVETTTKQEQEVVEIIM